MTIAARRKYPLELRERAVRMYRTSDPKPRIKELAGDLGVPRRPCAAGSARPKRSAANATTGSPLMSGPNWRSCVRRTPSSSGRTRSCGRPQLLSRPSST